VEKEKLLPPIFLEDRTAKQGLSPVEAPNYPAKLEKQRVEEVGV